MLNSYSPCSDRTQQDVYLKQKRLWLGIRGLLIAGRHRQIKKKLHIELKNEVFDRALLCTSRCGRALLCTSRCGGILKPISAVTTANVVEQASVFRGQGRSPSNVGSKVTVGTFCPPYLSWTAIKQYLNVEREKKESDRRRGERILERFLFIKVRRNFLLHSQLIHWGPTASFLKDLFRPRCLLAVKWS